MATLKLTDLKPDEGNFNKHTAFGMALLEKSMRKDGFVEAGLISEDNVICSGNARQETAVSIGMENVQIIDIDGTKPIYLRKKGLKSGTKEFKELALQLNAVGKANVVLDAELIEAELGEAVCVEWGIEQQQNFEDKNKKVDLNKDEQFTITLNYTADEFFAVKEAINNLGQTAEQILFKALKLG